MARIRLLDEKVEGGIVFGRTFEPPDFRLAQTYLHERIALTARDFLMKGAPGALVGGFDYALPGALSISIAAGHVVNLPGSDFETLPPDQPTVLNLAAADPVNPRIDLVYALLEEDVPAEIAPRRMTRLRTTEELSRTPPLDPYPPDTRVVASEEHTRATVMVKQGVPAANPAPQAANANEVPLFHVRVNAGAVALVPGNVTDVRSQIRSLHQLRADVDALTGGALKETVQDIVGFDTMRVTANTGLQGAYDDPSGLYTLSGVAATQANMGMLTGADKTRLDNLGTASTRNVGTAPGNVPDVQPDGKLHPSVLPASDLTSRVAKAGDTMTGALAVNAGGVALVAGAAAASGANKRAHVHGGLSVGAGVADTAAPQNGLLLEGGLILGNAAPVAGERLGVYSGETAAFVARLKNTAINGLGLCIAAGEGAPQHVLLDLWNREETLNLFRVGGAGDAAGRSFTALDTLGGIYVFDGHANNASGYGIRVRAGSTSDHPVLLLQTYNGLALLRLSANGLLGLGTETPNVTGVGGRLHVAGDTVRIDTDRSPASNASGNPGEMCADANFLYRCVAPNQWKRIAWGSY